MSKRFKRKLIFVIGSDCESPANMPTEYSNARLRWEADLICESVEIVNEFTLVSSGKMYFNLFLTDVRKHIDTLIDNDVTGWGIKIYRLTPLKRR